MWLVHIRRVVEEKSALSDSIRQAVNFGCAGIPPGAKSVADSPTPQSPRGRVIQK